MERAFVRRRDVVLDAWPLLLAIVLCLPLLTHGGYPLARDLVFVPHQPWTLASVGLGDGAPRAVPLDAVVAVLTSVIDGGWLARLVIPLILATAGWGTHRLVRDLGSVARLTAGGFAVWNPYVVERLALGQWALLAGYAALPWLLVAGRRYRESGALGDLGSSAAWLGLASLTPTGGVLGSLAVLAGGMGRSARTGWLVLVCLALQLPWLVPSLVGAAAATSDPAGVDAFSAGAEGPGGVLTALLGLGGIWDANSVPATRDSWWSTVTAVLVVASLVLGWRTLARVRGRDETFRLAALAAAGLVLAFVSSVPGGEGLVRWLVETVPGAGLLRDSQKFLAPLVVLAAVSLAAVVHLVVESVRRHGAEVLLATGLVAVPLPFLLVPDGAVTVWPTLRPVTYPVGFDRVAAILDDGPADATLATLPWRSYRGFSWGHGLISSDPATRWFDLGVLASDDLQVGPTTIHGEGLRARALGKALAAGPAAPALRGAHVTWALVYLDDPDAAALDLAGLTPAYADADLALYRVPGAVASQTSAEPVARTLTGFADTLALGLVTGGLVIAARRRGKAARTRTR